MMSLARESMRHQEKDLIKCFSLYANYFLSTHCLPYPNGTICNVLDESTALLGLDHFSSIQEGSDELVIGYEGTLDEWEEYLALGKDYLPTFFQQTEIHHKEGNTRIRLKDFQIDLKSSEITGASSLHLHLGYANDQLLAEELVMLRLFPQKGRPAYYEVRPYYEPSLFSSESYIGIWSESSSGTGDFSGKKIARGNRVVVHKTALQTEKTIIDPYDQKLKQIFTVGCAYKASTAEVKDVEQDCEHFFQSVEFAAQ